jgi:hypothetical protein
MNEFDRIQKQLIYKAERAHFEGLQHKGLAGTVCEDLLIKALRRSLRSSGLKFSRGVIKFATASVRGKKLDRALLSPQMDTIVYKGRPSYETRSQVVVPISGVKAVIEIKKWAHSKMMRDSLQAKAARIEAQLSRKSGRKVPFFFVTFRYKDGGKIRNWRSNLPTRYSYCFSGPFSSKSGNNLYPWQEKWWNNFEHYRYRGQYKKLVRAFSQVKKGNAA